MTSKPSMKEELLQDLSKELGGDPYRRSGQLQIHECENIALWAAKWMAERCAKLASETFTATEPIECPEVHDDINCRIFHTVETQEIKSAKMIEEEIRQLAKELQ